jgi:hypothetical protein
VSAVGVLQALSDPARLSLLARIAEAGEAGCSLEAAAGAAGATGGTGAAARGARKHVARLSAAGLVESRGPALVARLDRIRDALDELAGSDEDASVAGPARVRALFSRGRLVEIPRAPALRLELLRHLAERFEPGRSYREAEVNALLREVHDDHAALRRYLVDARLLGRDDDGATYWRAGDTSAPEGARATDAGRR